MRNEPLLAAALLAAWLSAAPPARGQAPPGADAPIPERRLDQYIKGYNFLVGTFGLRDQARLYAAQNIARKAASQPVNVSAGWIGLGDDDLRKGRNMDGPGLPGVDEAVDDMVPVLDRLVERLKGLEAYYNSRGPLADGFARGKREDPLVLADFAAALAALGPLDAALDHAITRRDAARLAVLRDRGDLVGLNGGLAVQRAKALVALVRTQADLKDPATVARADTLADGVLAALSDESTALDAAKAAGDTANALRDSMYGTAMNQLQAVVGTWRDMKRTGNIQLRPAMIGAYNAAVRNINVGN